ncbi:hypothetical protein TrRE_jg8811, partial [Triparma retinervis]
MDNDELWRTFQASFLVKLNSADFKQTFEARRNTLTSTTSPLASSKVTSSKGRAGGRGGKGEVGRTFQRRRSKTGGELREQIEKAAMPSPVPPTGEGNNTRGGEREGFFMTQGLDSSPSRTIPSNSYTTNATTTTTAPTTTTAHLPPPTESDVLALTKKSNLLRNRVETAVQQASAELRKPVPQKYHALKSLMDKLTHSPEERASFYLHISDILRSRSSSSSFNVIASNRASCGDGSTTREEVERRRAKRFEDRDRKMEDARRRVEGINEERAKGVEAKAKRREAMRELEVLRAERTERAREWCKVVKMAEWAQRVKPLFSALKASRVAASKESQLANKIIGLWSAKKAPSKGKKYRECVKKLRGFIKSKTSQWKRAQKQRAVDLMVLFLQEHRRANLPIVVRHFIGGVKTWQRWYRSYRRATEGRIRGMLARWEEVEARWFEKEEARMREEAREKRRMDTEFDLDKVLSSMGGRIQRGPKY